MNLIGDHATWHLSADAPLTSDIESLARPVSAFVHSSASAKDLPGDLANAVRAARTTPGGVATLIIPQDCAWDPAEGPAPPPRVPDPPPVADAAVEAAAAALRAGGPAALLLGGVALSEPGLRLAGRIAAATGCRLLHETFSARMERGASLPIVERIPYFPEQARETLAGLGSLVLAGARDPVAFFGYPGQASRLASDATRIVDFAPVETDVIAALEALAHATKAKPAAERAAAARPQPATGELTVGSLGQTLAALQPEGSIVVDEGATSGLAYFALSENAPAHTLLSLTGGAIGQGLPCAVGAALACPDRKVVAFQADGSGLYTLQALWTAAREGLDIVVLLCANRAYRILQAELGRAGIAEPGPQARALTELSRPEVDWVSLARGFGVSGVRVDRAEELADALSRAFATPGPALIEALL